MPEPAARWTPGRGDCQAGGMATARPAGAGSRGDQAHGAGIGALTPAAYHLRYRGVVERGDLTGAILDGRYRVIEPVAQGAMGTVYRAERVKLGRIVAIKVLHDALPNELSGRKRFEIEAMAMAKLEHPHCASVLDVGVYHERPYVVMDFVSGQNLKDVIATGPQPIGRAVEIVRQVLSGLAHAHELGIIHRDIKPANLVLSQKTGLGDHVKILDFGLARLHDSSQNLTTGVVVGTPAYMAPEQIRGTGLDPRADLYACGVLLFELLTAQKPFHSELDDPIEVCRMHLQWPIPRLDDKLPGGEFGELEAVAAKALAKDRDERYASAQEFAAALDAAVPDAVVRRPSQRIPRVPPSGPIPRGSSDPLHDASYPPAVEVRTADVIAAIPDPVAAQRTPGAPGARGSGDARGAARARTATPVAGTPAAAPGGGDAIPGAATRAEALAESSIESGPIFSPAGGPSGEAEGFTPPRVASRGSSTAGEASAPGTFFGLQVSGPTRLPTAPSPAPAGERPPRRWRRPAMIAGAALVAAIAVVAVLASRASGPGEPDGSGAAGLGAAGSGAATGAAAGPVREIIARASELATQGDREAALDLLRRARRQYPDTAPLAYTAGRICFSKFYWSEGIKHFRDAIRLDPAYRADPELIKIVLRGFITTPSYNDDLASFLHDDIGSAAQPLLEETARDHPSAMIRSRAAAELRRYH
jgi:eukaryotic-like serine/threonine-protein kinase